MDRSARPRDGPAPDAVDPVDLGRWRESRRVPAPPPSTPTSLPLSLSWLSLLVVLATSALSSVTARLLPGTSWASVLCCLLSAALPGRECDDVDESCWRKYCICSCCVCEGSSDGGNGMAEDLPRRLAAGPPDPPPPPPPPPPTMAVMPVLMDAALRLPRRGDPAGDRPLLGDTPTPPLLLAARAVSSSGTGTTGTDPGAHVSITPVVGSVT